MRTSEFDYQLPEELIAQHPIEPRDGSRLLVVDRAAGDIEHRHFSALPSYLGSDDLLVCNDSRVIPARLHGRKIPTGGRVELLLLHRREPQVWETLTGGRRTRLGTEIGFGNDAQGPQIVAEVVNTTAAGGRIVRFSRPIEPLLDDLGEVPLPPYIHEPLRERERYQTIYSHVRGSAAAPTAGLHFTEGLINRIQTMGVEFAFVTLHIGLDTFRPVREDQIEEHQMHSEYCELSAETAEAVNRVRARGGRVIAVGTTVVRVLETAVQQVQPDAGAVSPFTGWTDLFIYPSYGFRVVDALITNFHLPRSTLLMLVSAFAGKALTLEAYQEAIERHYRFYSFGDAMLIE